MTRDAAVRRNVLKALEKSKAETAHGLNRALGRAWLAASLASLAKSKKLELRPMSRRRARVLRAMHRLWSSRTPKPHTIWLEPEAYAVFVDGLIPEEILWIPFRGGMSFKGAKVRPRRGGLK